MEAYDKAEQFLKYPFDLDHGVGTVSRWTPQERDTLTIDNDGHSYDDIVNNSVPTLHTTSDYKNIICHFPPPDTGVSIGDHLHKLTITSDAREHKGLENRELKGCDVMVLDHGLGMDFRRQGDREMRSFLIKTNQGDVIAPEADDRIPLAEVNFDVNQYQNLDLSPHLNLYDPRMPSVGNHQVKGYYVVSRT